MKKCLVLASALAAALATSAPCAAFEFGKDDGRAYLGGSFGKSALKWGNPPAPTNGDFCPVDAERCVDGPTGFKFFVGQMLTPRLGVEFTYYNTGDGDARSGSGGALVATAVRLDGLALQGTAVLPLGPAFVQGRLGVAVARTTSDLVIGSVQRSDDKTRIEPVAGVGLGWNFSKAGAVRLDYDYLRGRTDFGNKFTANLISLGALMRF
jgi:opacity protein-like surface antigen